VTQLKLNVEKCFRRYQNLQHYVEWTDEDAQRVHSSLDLLRPSFVGLIDDFYDEITRQPEAQRAITEGADQIQRLKQTLREWLMELFAGQYDEAYVSRRWRVGLRHVEIGLEQVYTSAALSRLRNRILVALQTAWTGPIVEFLATTYSLNKLLDLDLAIIEDAYQSAYLEQQQRAERLIAVGQMAGGIAHELRNPLNVVKTSIYYLLNVKNPSTEKTIEHLHRIERQVGVADKVITALADFAKLPFPQVRRVHVKSSVTEALELASLPDGIAVRVDVAEDVSGVMADPDQFRIVLTNLLRNASDAMPTGGQLTINASAIEDFVEIDVSDTGIGISRESLTKIMQPLYSTKTRGLGLGLAITRAILEKHDGQLLVTSHEGQGSTFTVRLPSSSLSANGT
jgi:signal transduction histidine kinase